MDGDIKMAGLIWSDLKKNTKTDPKFRRLEGRATIGILPKKIS